ncbi:MAG: DUF465 domain-containing protein [Rhodovibrionaceae bacterium]|nr:DUF465 domain-containing protein [Rhodovibrionaceae bacterium]
MCGDDTNEPESEYVKQLRQRLERLKSEHRDLDDVIERMGDDPRRDELLVRRLKKRKLSLKDEIIKIETQLLPDIIA